MTRRPFPNGARKVVPAKAKPTSKANNSLRIIATSGTVHLVNADNTASRCGFAKGTGITSRKTVSCGRCVKLGTVKAVPAKTTTAKAAPRKAVAAKVTTGSARMDKYVKPAADKDAPYVALLKALKSAPVVAELVKDLSGHWVKVQDKTIADSDYGVFVHSPFWTESAGGKAEWALAYGNFGTGDLADRKVTANASAKEVVAEILDVLPKTAPAPYVPNKRRVGKAVPAKAAKPSSTDAGNAFIVVDTLIANAKTALEAALRVVDNNQMEGNADLMDIINRLDAFQGNN